MTWHNEEPPHDYSGLTNEELSFEEDIMSDEDDMARNWEPDKPLLMQVNLRRLAIAKEIERRGGAPAFTSTEILDDIAAIYPERGFGVRSPSRSKQAPDVA
jgi:hypothetical protein